MDKKKRIVIIAGARPNFIKIAVLLKKIKQLKNIKTFLIHSGQHYDYEMSEVFFRELDIPAPDAFLNVGSGTHAAQTANIMIEFEKQVEKIKPHIAVVVGDVNSTVACALVAVKMGVKVAHIEAGLRSFDRDMPEEINRIVTDSISEYLFVSEPSGLKNLKKEGVSPDKTFYVGNIMIDAMKANLPAINKSLILKRLQIENKKYCVITIHRPSNVDSKKSILKTQKIIDSISKKIKVVYPIHPRTKKTLIQYKLYDRLKSNKEVLMIAPAGYIEFMNLIKYSAFVLTDSGGIQEECCVLNIPCLTMRKNTERPVTISSGTNILVDTDVNLIHKSIEKIFAGKWKQSRIPKFWDGKTSDRILTAVKRILKSVE